MLVQQRKQAWPHSVKYERCGPGARMQAICLHEIGIQGNPFEQERHERQVIFLCYIREHLAEVRRIARAVVGRQAHADEQDLRACALCHGDHLFQVGARFSDWQATQAIIRAELEYDDCWLMQLERARQSLQPSAGGFATHTGIDYGGYVTLEL